MYSTASCPLCRATRRSVRVAAWGDDVAFTPATIASTDSITKDLKQITVSVNPEIAQSYSAGGQYVQMKVGDSKAAFMAIASAPGQPESASMMFVIKDTPDSTAHLITQLKTGDEVRFHSEKLSF